MDSIVLARGRLDSDSSCYARSGLTYQFWLDIYKSRIRCCRKWNQSVWWEAIQLAMAQIPHLSGTRKGQADSLVRDVGWSDWWRELCLYLADLWTWWKTKGHCIQILDDLIRMIDTLGENNRMIQWYVQLTVFLMAPEKFRTFSQFYHI